MTEEKARGGGGESPQAEKAVRKGRVGGNHNEPLSRVSDRRAAHENKSHISKGDHRDHRRSRSREQERW